MTIYKKSISEPWFSLICVGKKNIEGRLNKGDFKKMEVGDVIFFYNNDFDIYREVECIITKITKYDNFRKYLINSNIKKCLPTIENINDGINIYYKYYTREDEIKYGCVAIKIKICETQL